MENLPAAVTDGVHLYASVIVAGRAALSQVSIDVGDTQSLSLPSEIASPSLGDISPDGSKLLLRSHLSPESEQPLWVVPTTGGSALRVSNILAHDATWMPDGKGILYAAQAASFAITHLQDGSSTAFAKLPFGRAFWLRWSPSGDLVRFTVLDPIAHTLSLWELSSTDHTPRPLLTGWTDPAAECCGTWFPRCRKYYVFQSSHGGNPDLWRLDGTRTSGPVQITNGPLSFQAPVADPNLVTVSSLWAGQPSPRRNNTTRRAVSLISDAQFSLRCEPNQLLPRPRVGRMARPEWTPVACAG